MRFYYRLADHFARSKALAECGEPKPIELFPESSEIINQLASGNTPEYWGVTRPGAHPADFHHFHDVDEAMNAYYMCEMMAIDFMYYEVAS